MLNWATVHYTQDQVRSLFERATVHCSSVAMVMKTAYLEWTAIRQDIKAARKLYER